MDTAGKPGSKQVGGAEMPSGVGDRPLDELLTLDEVAAILKVPPSTVRKWRTEGTGPQGFRVGKGNRSVATSMAENVQELSLRFEPITCRKRSFLCSLLIMDNRHII
jgi:helix-turn-helix protein